MVYLQQCFYCPGLLQLSGVFVFPYDLGCCFFFNLWEELPWNRIRIVLNLRMAFGRMVVFTVSVLPFHEHEDLCAFLFLSFHFFVFEHFHCIGLFRGIL